MRSATVIIIGDEILSGKFRDENGPFLVDALRREGVTLDHLAIIADDLDVIADEVRRGMLRSDWVITTGGVGPTHDDVTFEGVARALGVPLVLHPSLAALLKTYGMTLDATTERMAKVPEGSRLVGSDGNAYPVILSDRVFMLPGIPQLVRKKWSTLAPELGGTAWHTVRVYSLALEHEVASALAELQARFPDVKIGSYPRPFAEGHRLIVTAQGSDPERVAAVRAELQVVVQAIHWEEDEVT